MLTGSWRPPSRDLKFRVIPRTIGFLSWVCAIFLALLGCIQQGTQSQDVMPATQPQANTNTDRSSVLKFRGILQDHEGKRLIGVMGVLFAIYEQKDGGSPLWLEVQNVEADDHGRFVALVGTTKSNGISPELFGTEKIRWLGMQVLLPGESEQPRIRFVKNADELIAQGAARLFVLQNPADQHGTVEERAFGQARSVGREALAGASAEPAILVKSLPQRRPVIRGYRRRGRVGRKGRAPVPGGVIRVGRVGRPYVKVTAPSPAEGKPERIVKG